MKPFLRWAGSKKQLLCVFDNFYPNNARYIEPFAGSACLFFHLKPGESVLGDLNQDLINTYRMVMLEPFLVIECLERLPLGKNNYYRIRDINPKTISEVEQAARFIYLNKFCFNGLYRTNKKGMFNVPYGDNKGNTGFDFELIISASKLLRTSQLICSDFEKTLELALPGDFVYLDPPYSTHNQIIFSEYCKSTFSNNDLQRLKDSLKKLDAKGVKFLVSYADCSEGKEILSDWDQQKVLTRRFISGFAKNRRSEYELFASNIKVGENYANN